MINPFAGIMRHHALRVVRTVEGKPEVFLKALGFPVTPENVVAIRGLAAEISNNQGDLFKCKFLKEVTHYVV